MMDLDFWVLFSTNPKDLDPSYDESRYLGLFSSRYLRLFRKGKAHIIAKFHRTDLIICSLSREGENPVL